METIEIQLKNINQQVTDKQLKYLVYLLSKNDSNIQDKTSFKNYLDRSTASKLIQGSLKGNAYNIIFKENKIEIDFLDTLTTDEITDIFMNTDLSNYCN